MVALSAETIKANTLALAFNCLLIMELLNLSQWKQCDLQLFVSLYRRLDADAEMFCYMSSGGRTVSSNSHSDWGSTSFSVGLSVFPVCPSTNLPVCVCLSVCLPFCLSSLLSTCLCLSAFFLSASLSICPVLGLCLCLSTNLLSVWRLGGWVIITFLARTNTVCAVLWDVTPLSSPLSF